MNRISSSGIQVPEADPVADFDDEPGYYKDIFYPDFDELVGETSIAFKLRYAFTCAGYRVMRVEEVETHPVLIVRAIHTTAPRIPEYLPFFRYIRDFLKGSGFPVKRDELTVDQVGKRILVAIPSGKPAADFREILREPQVDFVDVPP
jgi:hypothetical protein